jgi:predicted transcriptional regulator
MNRELNDNELLGYILEETIKSREVQVEMLKLLQKISADTKESKEYLEEIDFNINSQKDLVKEIHAVAKYKGDNK